MYPYTNITKANMHELPEGKRLGFVLGTGRCGTHSIEELLNLQEGVVFEHEEVECSWRRNRMCLTNNLIRLYGLLMLDKNTYLAGAIGYYFLPRIERALNFLENIQAICLYRPEEEVIRSFVRKSKRRRNKGKSRNWFTKLRSKHWDEDVYIKPTNYNRFPHYDLPMREAIGAYHKFYYNRAAKIQSKHPNRLKVYDMKSVLCEEAVQREALEFLGVKPDRVTIKLNIQNLGI